MSKKIEIETPVDNEICDVVVIVYLKSGNWTSIDISNTSLRSEVPKYAECYDLEKALQLLTHSSPSQVDMIPIANIDYISIQKKKAGGNQHESRTHRK